jgi:hypothetical protein
MAYYSDQGARIAQSVGEFFPGKAPPVAMAFKDGVFGQQLDENTPGPLMAHGDGSLGRLRSRRTRGGVRGIGEYFPGPSGPPVAKAFEDGSLGSLGAPLYVNGEVVDSPITISHGNTLGPGGANGAADVTDGGTLGAGASQSPGASGFAEDPGLLTSWQDGILGNPPYAETMPGPLRAQNQGIIGDPPYEHAPGYVWPTVPVSGLGAVSGGPGVLDLKDPATVRELKTALMFAWPESLTQDNQRIWDAAFSESAIWGPKASDLLDRWVEQFLLLPDVPAEVTRSSLVVDTPRGSYPTATGVGAIVTTGVGAPVVGFDFAGDFPILHAWMQVGQQTLGQGVSVVAPYFTESERVAGGGGLSMSTIALIGLGAVGVIGAVVVLGGRKRR